MEHFKRVVPSLADILACTKVNPEAEISTRPFIEQPTNQTLFSSDPEETKINDLPAVSAPLCSNTGAATQGLF